MSDKRQHRGPNPKDPIVFDPSQLPKLYRAAGELAWLLERGYPEKPSLQLVGNHHLLHRRQREALLRSVCSAKQSKARKEKRTSILGQNVAIDGFNLIINIEAALSGGVLVLGMDGWVRNLAAMHGSYRLVQETETAIDLILPALAQCRKVVWYLDQPVSNCGRLATMLRKKGCHVELHDDVDAFLIQLGSRQEETTPWIIATADSYILDHVVQATDIAGQVVAQLPPVWMLDFSSISIQSDQPEDGGAS